MSELLSKATGKTKEQVVEEKTVLVFARLCVFFPHGTQLHARNVPSSELVQQLATMNIDCLTMEGHKSMLLHDAGRSSGVRDQLTQLIPVSFPILERLPFAGNPAISQVSAQFLFPVPKYPWPSTSADFAPKKDDLFVLAEVWPHRQGLDPREDESIW